MDIVFNGFTLLLMIVTALVTWLITSLVQYNKAFNTGYALAEAEGEKELYEVQQELERTLKYYYQPVTVWVYESLAAGLPSQTREFSSVLDALDFADQFNPNNVTISREDNTLTLVIK